MNHYEPKALVHYVVDIMFAVHSVKFMIILYLLRSRKERLCYSCMILYKDAVNPDGRTAQAST